MASIVRALRTPPSSLTACAPRVLQEAAGVVDCLVRRGVRQERHVADDDSALGAAHDGPVWWSISSIVTRISLS